MADYRTHIYRSYVQSNHEELIQQSYEEFRKRKPYLMKLIRGHFPSNKDVKILDLGCGHGTLVHFAREAGYRNVMGVDVSPGQVAQARGLMIEGVHEENIFDALRQFPQGSQDVVVAFDVIEHFTKEEVLIFVDEVYRVLRADGGGGKQIIHCPNGESPFAGRVRYGDFTHELAFTRKSLKQLLLARGFSQVDCYEDTPIPHGIKSMIRFVCWKFIRSFLRLYLAAETGDWENTCILTQNFLTVAVK